MPLRWVLLAINVLVYCAVDMYLTCNYPDMPFRYIGFFGYIAGNINMFLTLSIMGELKSDTYNKDK